MKLQFLLIIALGAILTSCSSTYRTGQTPDDVYYSPARPVEENYQVRTYEKPRPEYNDRTIRMAIYDPRWRYWNDDYDAYYSPYYYGYNYGYYYNPYYYSYPVYYGNVTIRNPKNTTPRMTYLGGYNHNNYKVPNIRSAKPDFNATPKNYYNNSNKSSITRERLYTPRNNRNNDDNYDGGSRGYSPSSNSSSGSGSSSSGSGISRPGRGN